MLVGMKTLVNHAYVRRQFHEKGARVPRGFLNDLEDAVQVAIRHARDGKIVVDQDLKMEGDAHVKIAPLMDVLQIALDKKHVRAWLVHINALVAAKVAETVLRRQARSAIPAAIGVPGRVMCGFLRSPESQKMTLSEFCKRWQDTAFREEWVREHKPSRKARL